MHQIFPFHLKEQEPNKTTPLLTPENKTLMVLACVPNTKQHIVTDHNIIHSHISRQVDRIKCPFQLETVRNPGLGWALKGVAVTGQLCLL